MVQRQVFFYLMAFYLTYVWSTANRIVEAVRGESAFGLVVIHSFFDPLQGFLNYLVYQRPRYLRVREEVPEIGRLGAISRSLRFTFFGKHFATHPDLLSHSFVIGLEEERLETKTESQVKYMNATKVVFSRICGGQFKADSTQKSTDLDAVREEA